MNRLHSAAIVGILLVAAAIGLAACGDENLPPPSPTPTRAAVPAETGTPSASGVDLQLISDALTTTRSLKSYHYRSEIGMSADPSKQSSIEGDYVAPSDAYVRGTMGGKPVERLVVGTRQYSKDVSGQWKPVTAQSSSSGGETSIFGDQTSMISANPANEFTVYIENSKKITSGGQEEINGVQTLRFDFRLDINKLTGSMPLTPEQEAKMPDFGGGSIWIDPKTKYIHRINVSLDEQKLISAIEIQMPGTPIPGTPTSTPVPPNIYSMTITISRHNDPSITLPTPPTPGPVETPSPEVVAPTAGLPALSSATAIPLQATATTTPKAPPSLPSRPASIPTAVSTGVVPAAHGTGTPAVPNAQPTLLVSYKPPKALTVGSTGVIDGLAVTFNSVRRESSGYQKPPDGMQYLILNLTIENSGTQTETVSTIRTFAVIDHLGQELQPAYEAKQDFIDGKSGGKLAPGQKITGEAAYQVPANETRLTFIFTPLDDPLNRQLEFTLSR